MNSFHFELKDTASAIKNWLTHLLSEIKGFKFMTRLVLKFKKTQSDDKTLTLLTL